VSSGVLVLAALDVIGAVIGIRCSGFCRPKAVLTAAVGEAWPVPERWRCRAGAVIGDGDRGVDGHELSSPIGGIGRGWQPGSKVSMMIMRPPQPGHAFHSLSW